jgi:hypothetical protein
MPGATSFISELPTTAAPVGRLNDDTFRSVIPWQVKQSVFEHRIWKMLRFSQWCDAYR